MDPLQRIGKQVEEALVVHTDMSAEERRALALQALGEVDLPDPEAIYRKFPHECSGGMLQRVMIASAMITNPKLLLLDEPTNGMDRPSKAALRRIIASIASPEKLIIISTHQVDDLENLIDAAIIMDNNGILLNETLETIGQKLSFGPFDGESEIIYSEETLRGTWCVTRNESGVEAPVDMKLLFSAVVKHPGEFKQIFKQH